MEDIVVLEWAYSPADYFEEPISLKREKYDMTINNGKVEARIKPELYDVEPDMRNQLHNMLNNRFLGVLLLTHKNYELSKASMYKLHADGRKDITLFAEPCACQMLMGSIDLIQTDSDGNIIRDTRRERIDKQKRLSELTEKYINKNALASTIVNSYMMSVREPNNELIHLFEILEALSTYFGGDNAACKSLGVSNNKRSRLGRLANDEPLKQGRHRGKSIGELRDATGEELNEARHIARSLVVGYLEYLERQKP